MFRFYICFVWLHLQFCINGLVVIYPMVLKKIQQIHQLRDFQFFCPTFMSMLTKVLNNERLCYSSYWHIIHFISYIFLALQTITVECTLAEHRWIRYCLGKEETAPLILSWTPASSVHMLTTKKQPNMQRTRYNTNMRNRAHVTQSNIPDWDSFCCNFRINSSKFICIVTSCRADKRKH